MQYNKTSCTSSMCLRMQHKKQELGIADFMQR
jgi:hypothetical protein